LMQKVHVVDSDKKTYPPMAFSRRAATRNRPLISNRRGTHQKAGRNDRRRISSSYLQSYILVVGIGLGFFMFTFMFTYTTIDNPGEVIVLKEPMPVLVQPDLSQDLQKIDKQGSPKSDVHVVDEIHSSLDTSLHRTDAANVDVTATTALKKTGNSGDVLRGISTDDTRGKAERTDDKNSAQHESSAKMNQENPSVKDNDAAYPNSRGTENKMSSLPASERESRGGGIEPNDKSANDSKEGGHGSVVAQSKSIGEAEESSAGLPQITEEQLFHGLKILSQQSVSTATTPHIMKTKQLPDHERKRILVTGGAGFVGSHLVDKLMMEGHEVIVLDNFFTGQRKNIEHWKFHPNFSLIVHDVTEEIYLEIDQVYHLACPASPPHYQYNPIKTIKTSTEGTLHMLGLAKRVNARILLTSTSEIYGDPDVHPQPESYWGNVNTIGPRSCYDEGKRVAETMMYAYRDQVGVDVRVARIFNTFGPRMHQNDGRVVSNFIIQALQNKDITIYGTGEQSRSFQYVDDLVNGLYALMNGEYDMPVNLGNPDEYTVKRFAEHIRDITKSDSKISYLPASQDDPKQRRPDISTAKSVINWEPRVSVDEGLKLTIDYFQRVLDDMGEILPTGPGAAKPKKFMSDE